VNKRKILVPLGDKSYEVTLEAGIINNICEELLKIGITKKRKILVISNEEISNLYGEKFLNHLKDNNFENIDLVIVNFYPFEKTLSLTKNHKKIIENIDIGGPTMVRSAAKNYNDVTVITSSNQYEELIDELNKNKGSTSLKLGLIDGICNAEQILREKFGEDVVIKKLEKPKSFIAKKLSSSIDNQIDGIANVLEERALWQKFGL